jgi:uncharacterized protein YggE
MRVHRVVAVSEGGGFRPPYPVPMLQRMEAGGDAATPIAPGQIETTVNVSVTFELR